MSGKRYVLSEYKERKKAENGITIVDDAGNEYELPPIELWTDEIIEAAKSGDDDRMLIAMLGGQDKYDQFKANGGNALILIAIWSDANGVKDMGKLLASLK